MENEFKIRAAMYECCGEVLECIRRNKSYYTHDEEDDEGNPVRSEPTIEQDGDYTYNYYHAWDLVEKAFLKAVK